MSLKGLKVVFMGTPSFSLPALEALIDAGCDILGVVTRPDRPRGRGRKVVSPPVKELARKERLKVYQPLKVRDDGFIAELKALSPDVIVVVAFGQILPGSILDIPPMGCINIHASLLPAYRGAAPINRAVINGESRTGVTTILMDEGLDTGDILLRREVEIGPHDDSESLYRRLSGDGAELLIETLEGLKENSIRAVKQDDAKASLAPPLKKEDGLVNWSRSAEEIVNIVRGALPWPAAHTVLHGKGLKIYRAEKRSGRGRPGEVIKVDKDSFEAAAGEGSVAILELQVEGRKRMKTGEFLRGFSLKTGEVLGS